VTEIREWVALLTFSPDNGMFYEAGGVYEHEPIGRTPGRPSRLLRPGEHVVSCPRCGQRFAATDDDTAESNRDLHFDGDEDIPAVCRNMPARRSGLFTVVKGGE
jgi:hypothetical protein